MQQAAGFWAQDRWRLKPNLTLNYGLRWDFYGDNHDVSGFYSSPRHAGRSLGTHAGRRHQFRPAIWAASGIPMFQARQHAYNSQLNNPSPAIALAWIPQARASSASFGKNTVIRAGILAPSLRRRRAELLGLRFQLRPVLLPAGPPLARARRAAPEPSSRDR